MAPKTMKAIKIVKDGESQKAELQEVPVPQLRNDSVLCKVNCVALNPTDWLVVSDLATLSVIFIYSCSAS